MRSFFAIVAACAALNFSPALAQESAKQDAVRIEMDQKGKAFIFIIDDEPVAMLDKTGLHIPGEMSYGLWITDTGPDHIKQKIASTLAEADDE